MCTTTNYQKHLHRNPIQRVLIANFYRSFEGIIKPLSPRKILDVGCGEGFTLNRLREKNIGEKRVGVDFEKAAIDEAKKINGEDTFHVGNIYNLKFKDNEFDVVLCMEVMEHLKNPKKALSELKRVSSKYVVLTVPNEPWFRLSQLVRGNYLSTWGNHPEHINHWNVVSFRKFVKDSGLKVKKIRLPYAWIQILAEK